MDYTFSVQRKNIVKFLRAVDLLARPGGVSVRELGVKLGVARRSVYRLLTTLEDLGFPLSEVESIGREKRWSLIERYLKHLPNLSVPDVSLSERESSLLHFLLVKDKLWNDTEIGPMLATIRAKLTSFLPNTAAKREEFSLVTSAIDPRKDYRGKEGIIENLFRAIRERRVCTVKYHSFSAGTVKTYPIHPLSIHEHRGGLYLFAEIPRYGDIRILAVERMEALTVTRDNFEPPGDFDPQKLLDGALDLNLGEPVPVRIWVSAGQAPYIRERCWASDQVIEEAEDGSVVLSFTAAGFWDLKTWVLSRGAQARLLKPEWLVEEIEAELKDMTVLYRWNRT